MATPCDNAEAFVDGELSPAETASFRLHLAECARCQREVEDLLQLEFLEQRHATRVGVRSTVELPRATALRRWQRSALLAAACLAALILGLGGLRLYSSSGHSGVAGEAPYRTLEARLSSPGESGYKPLASGMLGPEQKPPQAVSKLREGEDPVDSYLKQGDRYSAARAIELLKQKPRTRDLESQWAVASWLSGMREEALQHADAALSMDPGHAPAMWNRALALRELHLPLAAAKAFSQVAALKEDGWAEEAAQQATELRRSAALHRDRWEAVFQAGRSFVADPASPLPEDFSVTPIARLFFYDAVRAASTPKAVQALLPMARELDGHAGGRVLESYVQRVAIANFEQRGPLAQNYAALLKGGLTRQEKERLLKPIIDSREDDLIVGALILAGAVAPNIELFALKATSLKDPWFQLMVAQERAAVDRQAGRLVHATRVLREVLPLCQSKELEYRCLSIKVELSTLLIKLHEFREARKYAAEAWQEARENNEWSLEQSALWNLGRVARLVKDTSLSIAYFEEYLEQFKGQPDAKRRIHENFASIAFQNLQVDEARREIDAAIATGEPLSPSGAFTLSDIARLKAAAGDELHLTRALERVAPKRSPGEHAVDTHVLGRFFIERDLARGRELLWRSIQEAAAPGLEEDLAALRARAYSYTSLIFEAGRREAFDEALELFSKEHGQQLPSRCLLAAAADSERTLLIVRGQDGKLLGWQDESRLEPLPEHLDGLVREDLLAALQPCERVEVLARPPLHSRTGLLPMSMAWSYLTRVAPPRVPRTGPAVHLVVSGVELPKDLLDVRALPFWAPPLRPGARLVQRMGAEATPSRVRAAMKDATEIDLITHGFVNERSDESYLLLSVERGERELTVPQVRQMRLQGAPFVVLMACYGGRGSYALHEPWSLPVAFIHAGARGVLAATEQIPGEEATVFFTQVRKRMNAGVPPAIALRDVRAQWLERDPTQTWLASVLLFE